MDTNQAIRRAPSWNYKVGEPVPEDDLNESPTWWLVLLLLPDRSHEIRDSLLAGKMSAKEVKSIILRSNFLNDPTIAAAAKAIARTR
jgi:hypothetical protein